MGNGRGCRICIYIYIFFFFFFRVWPVARLFLHVFTTNSPHNEVWACISHGTAESVEIRCGSARL